MPRGRIIHPNAWTDSKFVKLSPFARLLFIGSWNYAYCDQGHLDDDPEGLALKVLPRDPIDAVELLEEIMAQQMIVRQETPDGKPFLRVVNFSKWQAKDDTRWSPKCPVCKNHSKPLQTTDVVSVEGSGEERSRGEGTTRGARPPRVCSNHPNGTDGGCLKCRDARLAQQEWDRRERDKVPATAKKDPKTCTHKKHPTSDYCAWCYEPMTDRSN